MSLPRGGSSGSGLSIAFETLTGLLTAVVLLLWTLITQVVVNRRKEDAATATLCFLARMTKVSK